MISDGDENRRLIIPCFPVNVSTRWWVIAFEKTCMSTTATMSDIEQSEFVPELEGLFRQHSRLVYRTAFVITGRSEDAEDVLQTIFLRLARRATPPSFNKNPARYLYTAAVNVSINVIRSRRRQVLLGDLESFDAPQNTETPNVDEATIRELRRAIAKLSARTVEILILRYVHDCTEPEIAKLLGISRGTIAVTLFRSRNRLRKLLSSRSGENK